MNIGGGTRWTIVGQGLAGTCLAWHLWQRGASFEMVDGEQGGSSRIAAGMINPVTGKNFEPSWRIGEFLPDAVAFYMALETLLSVRLWHPLPVLRLAASEKEWLKISSKCSEEHVKPWISSAPVAVPEGWHAAVEVTGGGRLDTRAFLDASREFFRSNGRYTAACIASPFREETIWCDGAAGLMSGGYGAHRCAKGEILTLRAGWPESHIRIGGGGWLVPLGSGLFKAGATYEWHQLDDLPTSPGRSRGEEIALRLGGEDYQVVDHEAGIRPIMRRSEPLIGPLERGGWMFNGLGSKGSLYAPGMADRLACWLLEGREPEADVDFRNFISR